MKSEYIRLVDSHCHNCLRCVRACPGFRQLEKGRYSNVRINSAFFMSNEKFLCSDSSGM